MLDTDSNVSRQLLDAAVQVEDGRGGWVYRAAIVGHELTQLSNTSDNDV